ncbi:ABC transporter ATP-binding protein [Consotaella salsifontis]|uniref:Putative spermidine/putrescine transport system ATP-binding protein n=1 Tax=Consotaella salsifontis TaxID=1365950 RepID=A0A1T4PKE7_9HYPH|nr:ABC transporter ATP-binding protein [Consotaella salsifontis]SJZ92025.1 putative spermidine/putrescine transport system ATP-binding protein [Consotaella salsifontis]
MAEVRVENLTKTYGPLKALDAVTLDFRDGGFFGLLGPSGSGKTTLLRAIAGFVIPDDGRVLIGGEPVERVPVEAREIGMVFQSYALFPNMTVADNVAFGLDVRRIRGAERDRRVKDVLDLVQLGDLGQRKPHQLSGGQKQRVAMARAIVTRPRVLLLDEPLSALDKALRVEMQVELKRIQREVGITTIFVTHDQEEALTLSDEIGILRNGRLVRHGPPREVYNNPRDAFTARFLGEANLFSGSLEAGGLRLPDGALIPGATTAMVAVRPENVQVSASEPSGPIRLRAEIRRRIFAGAMGTLILDRHGEPIKAIARDSEFAELPDNGRVWLSWREGSAIPVENAPN